MGGLGFVGVLCPCRKRPRQLSDCDERNGTKQTLLKRRGKTKGISWQTNWFGGSLCATKLSLLLWLWDGVFHPGSPSHILIGRKIARKHQDCRLSTAMIFSLNAQRVNGSLSIMFECYNISREPNPSTDVLKRKARPM